MLGGKTTDHLLESIRMGRPLRGAEKLNLIIGLSIPSILAQVTSVLMFFIDASMVGHLGAKASASIGLVESSTWLMGSVMGALSTGFSVQVAHFVGANDFVRARQVFRHALVCGLLFSLLVMMTGVAVSGRLPYWLGGGADIAADSSTYFLIFSLAMPFVLLFNMSGAMLKSSGNMRTPSAMSISAAILDVAFNFLFIYQLELGVAGAAMGTLAAYILTSGVQTYMATCRSKILALRLDRTRFQWMWQYVRTAVKISTPIAIQGVLMSGAQVVSTLIVAPLGNIAIAANSFAITVESLCYMPGYGIGDAATTLVGQTHGAGRMDLCKNFAHLAVGMGMAVMAVMGVVMYIFAPEMLGLLSPVAEIRDLGAGVLRIEAFAEPFFAASIVTAAVCVGAGDTLRPAIINLCSMWFVRLSLAWMLSKSMGLRGVWIAMAAELTFRGTLFLIRLFRGNWLKSFATPR